MYEIILIGAVMSMLMAKKKTPIFGQMTLTGEKALDWVKDGVKVTASKIQMGGPMNFDEWNLPEWGKEKTHLALIFPVDAYANPFLVTQASILKVLEAKCAEFEEQGCLVEMVKTTGGPLAQITFSENHPTFEFIRPKNAKTYDPYKVVIE